MITISNPANRPRIPRYDFIRGQEQYAYVKICSFSRFSARMRRDQTRKLNRCQAPKMKQSRMPSITRRSGKIPLGRLIGSTPTLQKFSEMEARRVVFPGAARSVANRSVASPYVRIGNASTDPGNAAIPGSVAFPARKFLQRWGQVKLREENTRLRMAQAIERDVIDINLMLNGDESWPISWFATLMKR